MNSAIYAKINAQFNKKRQQRDLAIDERKRTVYADVPRIQEIDDEISSLAFSMLEDVSAGKNSDAVVKEFGETLKSLNGEKKTLLAKNGYKPDFLDIPYACSLCRDTGLYKGKRCKCYNKLLSEELLAESNLSDLMKKQTFSSFELKYYRGEKKNGELFSPKENIMSVMKICKRFADEFDKTHENLLLYGAPGLGKTFLSSAIANRAIERGFSVIYASAGDIFSRLEDIKFGRTDGSNNKYDMLTEADLLLLDDLGTEFRSVFTDSELFKILNARILLSKSTIISTNLTLADIKRFYSERVLSRVLGEFNSLKFYGDDIRPIINNKI